MQIKTQERIDNRIARITASERVLNAAIECKNAAGCIPHEHGESARRMENLAAEIYNIALDLTPE